MSDLPHESLQEHRASLFDLQDKSLARLVLEGLFLSREELAKQLNVSPRTILRWEVLRIGVPRICVGRKTWYSVQSLREWLLSREQQALPPRRRRGVSRVKR